MAGVSAPAGPGMEAWRRVWVGEIEGRPILTLGLDLLQVRGCITSKALLIALLSFFPFI